MRACFQFQGMSILDHGYDVRQWYLDLEDALYVDPASLRPMRLPSWFDSPAVRDHYRDADDAMISLYQVYHDCGKPLCRTVDEAGRQHFPDHAAVSKARWLECGGSPEVGELIGMDMDVHTLKSDGVAEFASRPQAVTLLLTGLAELHSNAQMFGGIESTGFKIKFRKLEKLGCKILGTK